MLNQTAPTCHPSDLPTPPRLRSPSLTHTLLPSAPALTGRLSVCSARTRPSSAWCWAAATHMMRRRGWTCSGTCSSACPSDPKVRPTDALPTPSLALHTQPTLTCCCSSSSRPPYIKIFPSHPTHTHHLSINTAHDAAAPPPPLQTRLSRPCSCKPTPWSLASSSARCCTATPSACRSPPSTRPRTRPSLPSCPPSRYHLPTPAPLPSPALPTTSVSVCLPCPSPGPGRPLSPQGSTCRPAHPRLPRPTHRLAHRYGTDLSLMF